MTESTITTDIRGHVLCIGITRPEKRNASDVKMYRQLARAYGQLEAENDLMLLMQSRDVKEGITAFIERREASFTGQ